MKWTTVAAFLYLGMASAFQPFLQPGVSKPLGFFDPLGLSSGKTENEFKKFQEAEVKHGRVAMLASLGLLIQEKFHPLISGTEIGNPIYHYQVASEQLPFLTPLLLTSIGLVEAQTIVKGWKKTGFQNGIADLKSNYIPGDLGLNPLTLTDEQFHDMRTKELNHGRLAMLATVYLVVKGLLETTTTST